MSNPTAPNVRPVRVRFAPSPTGYLHVGGARTALFNWLFARHFGGTMILRIEDTDAERSTQEAVDMILDALRWLGIDWDEGPYIQTERHARHREVLNILEASGSAYRSYVTPDEIETMRAAAEAAKLPFTYKRSRHEPDAAEAGRREASGMPFVLRLDIGDEGAIVFDDHIRGAMSFRRSDIGDLVLSRSDGSMLYNFVCTVDDVDSQITHVIRGEDHLSNTPKQIALYEALGATPPQFAHVALILGTDKQRLSKRHGATSVQQFREMGMLPDAMVNFLALLGWSADDKTEIFSRADLVRLFSLDRVNPAPAVFDQEKLLYLNGMYIRNAPREEVTRMAREELRHEGLLELPGVEHRGEAWVDSIIALEIERSRTLRDFAKNLAYFFHAPHEYEPDGVKKFLQKPGSRAIVDAIVGAVEAAEPFDAATLEPALRGVAAASAVNFTRIAQPIRIALTGRTASPPLFDVMVALGRDETLLRLRQALPLASA